MYVVRKNELSKGGGGKGYIPVSLKQENNKNRFFFREALRPFFSFVARPASHGPRAGMPQTNSRPREDSPSRLRRREGGRARKKMGVRRILVGRSPCQEEDFPDSPIFLYRAEL